MVAVMSFSCVSKRNDNAGLPVPVSVTKIPQQGATGREVSLKITATAPNGCWSDIKIQMNKESKFDYQISASGKFRSGGMCTMALVEKDTIVKFIPRQRGTYVFSSASGKGQFKVDSLVVK